MPTVSNQKRFDPAAIATACAGEWLNLPTSAIERFHFDSREVRAGTCFVALKTGARDGHSFLAAALKNGAVAALVSEPQAEIPLPQLCVKDTLTALQAIAAAHRKTFVQPLAAITGSFGKTSTKEMLVSMLGESQTAATPGNWNNHIGVPLTLLQIDPAKHHFAVVEAGISEPGEMPPLGKLARANHVLFTGIGPAHLEALGDEAGVAREKFALAEHAAEDAALFFPCSCLAHEPFRTNSRPCHILVEADSPIDPQRLPQQAQLYRYQSKILGNGSQQIELVLSPEHHLSFTLASESAGMAGNAALAALAAHVMGRDHASICAGIANWRSDSKRGSWQVDAQGRRWFVDCYNANPMAMRDSLSSFLQHTAKDTTGRLFVLGTMLELGERATEWHHSSLVDFSFSDKDHFLLIGDATLCQAYANALQAGSANPTNILQFDQTPETLPPTLNNLQTLFLKGSRSHQLEKLLSGT